MTREEIDSDTFEGTITTGTNEKLSVSTSRADDVLVLIDDSTQDGAPASYDMTARVETDEIGAYQQLESLSVTTSTANSHEGNGYGKSMEFEFNNQSGANATYRIVVKSYRQME